MGWKKIMFAHASHEDAAPEAMAKAMRLALALNAELELFNCVYDRDIDLGHRFAGGFSRDISQMVERHQRRLERTAMRLRQCGVAAHASVGWDHPAYEGIVRQALRVQPDLLIAQSRPRSRTARALFTHSDFKLIETCPCPLLLIKSLRPYSGGIVAAVDPLCAHGKPEALDDAVVDAAARMSQALRRELCIYHVCMPWSEVMHGNPDLARISEAEEADARSAYERHIEERLRNLARRHQLPETRVRVVGGDVAEVLPEFAKSERANLVVMGAVSRSFVERVLIGHTSERLLDRLACDLLVVKPPGFHTPVSDQSTHRRPGNAGVEARPVW